MRKVLLVARHEYLELVRKRSFLIGTLGLPVLLIVVMAIAVISSLGPRGDLPVGYVDAAGVITQAELSPADDSAGPVAFAAYADESAAAAALREGAIQAFFILPQDYLSTGRVELVYLSEKPGELIQEDFADLLRRNLVASQTPSIRDRLYQGSDYTFQAVDGSREFESNNILNFLIPFVAAFAFVIAVISSAGYMLQAVTDEKENRTIEILTTSLRPEELIGGKALGLICVSLTQLALWVMAGLAALLVLSRFVPQLQGAAIPWSALAVVGVFFLPAYALQAGLMTAIGGIVTDLRQGQQIAGILNLLFTLPFFFIALIMADPQSPVVVALMFFPTSAFVTVSLRWALTAVPLWQLLISWLVVVGSAALSIWAAARIFRAGMLQVGQRLSLKQLWRALRG